MYTNEQLKDIALRTMLRQNVTADEKAALKAYKNEVIAIATNSPDKAIEKLQAKIAVIQAKIDEIIETGVAPAPRTRKAKVTE